MAPTLQPERKRHTLDSATPASLPQETRGALCAAAAGPSPFPLPSSPSPERGPEVRRLQGGRRQGDSGRLLARAVRAEACFGSTPVELLRWFGGRICHPPHGRICHPHGWICGHGWRLRVDGAWLAAAPVSGAWRPVRGANAEGASRREAGRGTAWPREEAMWRRCGAGRRGGSIGRPRGWREGGTARRRGLWPARGAMCACGSGCGRRARQWGSGARRRCGVGRGRVIRAGGFCPAGRRCGGAACREEVRCGAGALPGREDGRGSWSFGSGLCGAVIVAFLGWGGRSDGAGLR
ncbi:hypothetical protein PVAP13_5NG514586 [Panicum virgatum]|uniref:Uncharacterized protein n=1 Tax=Panicum virgatum TaxID=38727 RepID=A0A8T0S5Y3_PANVG|nr:hypothetical protein PVAP13_5NG514586 [Panicum virgatum]